MPTAPKLTVEVEARPALELLIGLSAATSPAETHDESWVPLARALVARAPRRPSSRSENALARRGCTFSAWRSSCRAGDAQSFVEALARVDALELRRHLVGVHVPAWVGLVGASTLEQAATGDEKAIATLLEHPRYYAGRAAEALPTLLSVPPQGDEAAHRHGTPPLRRGEPLRRASRRSWPRSPARRKPRARSPRPLTPQALIATRHAGVRLRARAGVRPRRARPARRRATAPPPLPAPRCARDLLPGLAAAARP